MKALSTYACVNCCNIFISNTRWCVQGFKSKGVSEILRSITPVSLTALRRCPARKAFVGFTVAVQLTWWERLHLLWLHLPVTRWYSSSLSEFCLQTRSLHVPGPNPMTMPNLNREAEEMLILTRTLFQGNHKPKQIRPPPFLWETKSSYLQGTDWCCFFTTSLLGKLSTENEMA